MLEVLGAKCQHMDGKCIAYSCTKNIKGCDTDGFSHRTYSFYTSEAILSELETLPRYFVIGVHAIRYTDCTVLTADTEEKHHHLLGEELKERPKKGLSVNCKNIKWMVVSKRKKYKLRIVAINIQKV